MLCYSVVDKLLKLKQIGEEIAFRNPWIPVCGGRFRLGCFLSRGRFCSNKSETLASSTVSVCVCPVSVCTSKN